MTPSGRVLVDTSVWVDHLRHGDPELVEALEESRVLTHPFVIGELACGRLPNRAEVLGLLDQLPASPVATHEEALHVIESRKLMGRGVGWVDVHLLASAAMGGVPLWTRNGRLGVLAAELGLAPEDG